MRYGQPSRGQSFVCAPLPGREHRFAFQESARVSDEAVRTGCRGRNVRESGRLPYGRALELAVRPPAGERGQEFLKVGYRAAAVPREVERSVG